MIFGTDNFLFRQVLLPRTITMIAMILTAIAVKIAIWTQMITPAFFTLRPLSSKYV